MCELLRQVRAALQSQLATALGADPAAVIVTRVSPGGACLNFLPPPPGTSGGASPAELAERLQRQLREEGSRVRTMSATRTILVCFPIKQKFHME